MRHKMSNMERRAHAFASQHHAYKKYGQKPCMVHLKMVRDLVDFYASQLPDEDIDPMLAAAWLHDVVEDTAVRREDIAGHFGERVAELVWAVTDEPGATRAERKLRTYPKIRKVAGATFLKLCDRIANLRWATSQRSSHLGMYLGEAKSFERELRRDGELLELWQDLSNAVERARQVKEDPQAV